MSEADQFVLRILGARRRGVLDGITLDVPRGEFLAIIGPRQSGKSSLLRVIAGHDRLDEGVIYLAGRDVTHVAAHERPVNLVPGRAALFPHLTVEQNIGFGLKYAGAPTGQHSRRIARAVEMLGLSGLEGRLPGEIPAEQAQRVAIARALAVENPVLLMDDALEAFDPPARQQAGMDLRNLQQRTGLTVVMVTRDSAEAIALADRIAVLNGGRVEQLGPAQEVFDRPRTEVSAKMMGASNFVGAKVAKVEGAILTIGSPAGFQSVLLANGRAFVPGDAVRFVVRPERLRMKHAEPDPSLALAFMEVTIEERVARGAERVWIVRNRSGERVFVREDGAGADGEFVVMGKAWVCWDPRDAVVVE